MNDREKFEADAKELGFDLTRTEFNPNVEPWDDYIEDDTGHRYGGFIAGYQAATAESAARIAELEKIAARYQALKDLALTPQIRKTFAISKYTGFGWEPYELGGINLDEELDKLISEVLESDK